MIRKMIGAAVDVAQSKIKLDYLRQMIISPSDFYGGDSITILNPNGLFLKSVNYN